MHVRKFSSSDYAMVCEWWAAHGWTDPPPLDNLPAEGGFIVDEAAAGFVYKVVSGKFAIIEFTVVNPALSKLQRGKAMLSLVKKLLEYGKNHVGPGGYVYTMTAHPAMKKMYEKCGMRLGENNVSSFFYQEGKQHDHVGFLD